MKMRASPALRSLMSKAAHIPMTKRDYGTCEAEGDLNGYHVRIIGSMAERLTLDGWAPVLTLRSYIDGKRVSRARLFQLCGEPA